MTVRITSLLLLATILAGRCLAGDTPMIDGCRDITFQQLKAAPDDYTNRKVTYTGRFRQFFTTFYPYMQESGFEANRYYALLVQDGSVPVMARKNSTMTKLMGEIRPGVMVRVYGRVKKFRKDPGFTPFPRYYVDLDRIELIQSQPQENPPADGERPAPPIRRRLRR